MPTRLLAIMGMALLTAPNLGAQLDSSYDTVTIIESSTRVYEGHLVDYFVLDIGDARLAFIEDTAHVVLIATESEGDTTLLPDPRVWFKTGNPTLGDLWPGMIPTGTDLYTNEVIDDTIQAVVPAGTFPVYKVHCYDIPAGAYLGQKWWSDGVGLVGWDLQICNQHDRLELVEYDVSSGTDFWPHQVGDSWVYLSIGSRSFTDAEQFTPTIDGSPDDWLGHPSVLQDYADDSFLVSGTDIADVYAASDPDHLYLLLTFWDGSPDTVWAADAGLGYVILVNEQESGLRWGYSITYEPAPVSEWRATGINLSNAGIVVRSDLYLEMSIPRSSLGGYSNQLPNFKVIIDSGYYDYSCVNDVRLSSCPILFPGDVTGDLTLTPADIVFLVNYVLKAGATPVPCAAAGDLNCNAMVSTSDIIYLVNRIFKAGPPPCDVCAMIPGTWTCP